MILTAKDLLYVLNLCGGMNFFASLSLCALHVSICAALFIQDVFSRVPWEYNAWWQLLKLHADYRLDIFTFSNVSIMSFLCTSSWSSDHFTFYFNKIYTSYS